MSYYYRDDKKKYKSDQYKSDSSSSLSNFIYSHKTTEISSLPGRGISEQLHRSHSVSRKNRADAEEARIITSNHSNFCGRDPRSERAKDSPKRLLGEDWKQACSEHRKRIGERLSRECQLGMRILLQEQHSTGDQEQERPIRGDIWRATPSSTDCQPCNGS